MGQQAIADFANGQQKMIDFKNPIFTEPYWKRPPNQNQGDVKAATVYEAVGYALSNWEMMEENLAQLYLALASAPSDPVRRAFGSIESNTGRRKAIEAAAEAYFGRYWEDDEVRRAFRLVVKAVEWAAKRRDDIAHGIVLGQQIDDVHFGVFLFPPDYNTSRTHLYADTGAGDPLAHTMTKYRFTSDQIRAFAVKFTELRHAVEQYAGHIMKDGETIVFVRAVKGGSALG